MRNSPFSSFMEWCFAFWYYSFNPEDPLENQWIFLSFTSLFIDKFNKSFLTQEEKRSSTRRGQLFIKLYIYSYFVVGLNNNTKRDAVQKLKIPPKSKWLILFYAEPQSRFIINHFFLPQLLQDTNSSNFRWISNWIQFIKIKFNSLPKLIFHSCTFRGFVTILSCLFALPQAQI